jgi:2-polyprenyl-6-methoxyphenol hydroxylase-like FAD-dependent oxidoreductase
MQFHHAHLFRPQCAEVLQTHLPAAYQAWLEAGAEPIQLSRSDGTRTMFAVRSRRQTFETALRVTVLGMPAVTFHRGHVDAVATVGGRATGVKVASSPIGADLVIDASGRAGRVADRLRPAPSVGVTAASPT